MITVLGDRVLVALPPKEAQTTTESGLVLVRDPDLKVQTRGIVMALGEKTETVAIDRIVDLVMEAPFVDGPVIDPAALLIAVKALESAPFDVALGDCVLFPVSAGEVVELDGVSYVILREAEIIGVVEPLTKDEAAA